MTKEDVDKSIKKLFENLNDNNGLFTLCNEYDLPWDSYLKISDILEAANRTLDTIESEKLYSQYLKSIFPMIDNSIPNELKDYFYMQMLKEGGYRSLIMFEDDNQKIKYLDEIADRKHKMAVIKTMEDDNILAFLQQFDENEKILLIGAIKNPEKKAQALDEIEGEYKDVLKRMYQKNVKVLEYIDTRILNQEYLQTLGEDKINLISCYPHVQKRILSLPPKEYSIFIKCLDNYILQKPENDEWTPIAEVLLDNLSNGQYAQLIQNIEDIEEIDIQKLSKILQLTNDFDIKTIEDVKNYEEIRKIQCDEIMNKEGNIEDKKKAVLLKLVGQDYSYAQKIIEKYAEDISCISDGEEKDFVIALQEIMQLQDEDILRQIYNQCESVGLIDKTFIERQIKTAYGKKYNEGLYEPNFEDLIEEKDLPEELKGLNLNVYDAGIDFKMIITSIAPYVENEISDFEADWNRPIIDSQHFCASYIRNDNIKRAPIPHLCYGFTQMKDDALMLSGNGDIYSDTISFSPQARWEKYYSPDRLIKETQFANELDFRRIQGETKKQPAYIVAFRSEGKIDNIEKITQAAKDWKGKLAIVIIDEDKLFESGIEKINTALNEGKLEEAIEGLKEVKNIRNRWNGKEKREQLQFLRERIKEQSAKMEKEVKQDVEISSMDDSTDKTQHAKAELLYIHNGVSASDRQEGIYAIRKLRENIQNITQKRNGEELGG